MINLGWLHRGSDWRYQGRFRALRPHWRRQTLLQPGTKLIQKLVWEFLIKPDFYSSKTSPKIIAFILECFTNQYKYLKYFRKFLINIVRYLFQIANKINSNIVETHNFRQNFRRTVFDENQKDIHTEFLFSKCNWELQEHKHWTWIFRRSR